MSSTYKNNLKTKIIYKIFAVLSFIAFVISGVFLLYNVKNEIKLQEKNFSNDALLISAPMIESVESLYADAAIDDETISSAIKPVLESDENISIVRVWNAKNFLEIAIYKSPDGSITSSPNDPYPSLSVNKQFKMIISGQSQKWTLKKIDNLLNILYQQQLISDKYDELLKKTDINLELRSEIYNMQNMLIRNMPALVKKYPDLSAALNDMNLSLDALEMDTIEDIRDGHENSEKAISIISMVLEQYRASNPEDISNIIKEKLYQPVAASFSGILFNKIKCDRQFVPVTRPAINNNFVEVAAVIEIVSVRRLGDYYSFWTWQWYLCPLFLVMFVVFLVLSRKKVDEVKE